MKRFKIEQSDKQITATSGLALIGQAIRRHTTLARRLDKDDRRPYGEKPLIAHFDHTEGRNGLLVGVFLPFTHTLAQTC